MEFWEEVSRQLGQSVTPRELSKSAQESIVRLGVDWIVAAIKPILIAHPESSVRLDLMLADTEPLGPQNRGTFEVGPAELPQGHGYLWIDRPSTSQVDFFVCRLLVLPSLALLEGRNHFTFIKPRSPLHKVIGKAYREAYDSASLPMDVVRSRHLARREKQSTPVLNRATRQRTPLRPLEKPVMWIAMHWLENGGAESWAIEQIKIAKAAGFHTIVTVDKIAPQRNFEQVNQIADEILLAAQSLGEYDWNAFALNLVKTRQVDWIHIHHSVWTYISVHLLKSHFPALRVEDSTHIFESQGGGFVDASIAWCPAIDLHHVISPQLVKIMREAGIPEEEIAYYPLTSLQKDGTPTESEKTRDKADKDGNAKTAPLGAGSPTGNPSRPSSSKLRIGFLGRLVVQKRPLLFVSTVKKLEKRYPGRFTYLMQGSGVLEDIVARHLAQVKGAQVERRSWGAVSQFFSDIDVLLITSENEGLTLTALEADRHNVLVVSTDVGSQKTVTAPECLLPRQPLPFIKAAQDLLGRLGEPAYFDHLLAEQHELVTDLRAHTSASDFYVDHYQQVTGRNRQSVAEEE